MDLNTANDHCDVFQVTPHPGRGVGNTYRGVMRAALRASDCNVGEDNTIVYICADWNIASHTYFWFAGIFLTAGCKANASLLTFTFPNGSKVVFMADSDNLQDQLRGVNGMATYDHFREAVKHAVP